jgi:hypothetical protein
MPKFIIVHYEEDPAAIQKFISDVRALWNDHVNYTRNAIISIADGLGDINDVMNRLNANQDSIGQVLTSYYSEANATTLTNLLKDHVATIADIIGYKKADKDTTDLEIKAQANIAAIADLLSSLDPMNWPKDVVLAALTAHLKDTIAEIDSRIKQYWAAEIAAFDKVKEGANAIADTMSKGIIDKFPEKFVKYDL